MREMLIKNKKWVISAAALLLCFGILLFAITSCGKAEGAPEPSETASQVAEIAVTSESPKPIPSSENEETPLTNETDGSISDDSAKTGEKATPTEKPTSTPTPKPSNTPAGGTTGGNTTKDTGSNTGSTPAPASTPKPSEAPKGHYEKVWIVDKAAYSYEEDVYEEKAICRCACGADITGNTTAHMKAHALNNEPYGSWREEWIKVKTGTKTITVPEQGHWEQVWVAD